MLPALSVCKFSGMAGGTPKESHSGAQYFATQHAKQGDLGSKTLKPAPTGLVWEAGGVAEVSWTINAKYGLPVKIDAENKLAQVCRMCTTLTELRMHVASVCLACSHGGG